MASIHRKGTSAAASTNGVKPVLLDKSDDAAREAKPWPWPTEAAIKARVDAYFDELLPGEAFVPEPAEPPPPLIGFALDSETDGDVAGRPSERLEVALHRCGVTVRYNTRAARAEYQHWQPRNRLDDADDRRFEMCAMQMTTPWEGWTDPTTAHVKEVLAAHFRYERADGKKAPLKFGGEAWHNALGALMYRREVDPFVEWIEDLPAWDDTPRLDTWLERAFTISERLSLAQWASRYILLGAIVRAYEPGTKLDETPILIGTGGIGKSTSLRHLLPAARHEVVQRRPQARRRQQAARRGVAGPRHRRGVGDGRGDARRRRIAEPVSIRARRRRRAPGVPPRSRATAAALCTDRHLAPAAAAAQRSEPAALRADQLGRRRPRQAARHAGRRA